MKMLFVLIPCILLILSCGTSNSSTHVLSVQFPGNMAQVGQFNCSKINDGDYPRDGHLIDCSIANPGITRAVEDAISGRVSDATVMMHTGPANKTHDLAMANVVFYIFDNQTDYMTMSQLPGSSTLTGSACGSSIDVSSYGPPGSKVGDLYTAVFIECNEQGRHALDNEFPLISSVEATIRHEIGHQLDGLYDLPGVFNGSVTADFADFDKLDDSQTINIFIGQADENGNRIILGIVEGQIVWASGYAGLKNSERFRKAFPHYFCESKDDSGICADKSPSVLYREFAAEEFTVAQGGGPGGSRSLDSYVTVFGNSTSFIFNLFRNGKPQ
jgi:hypothetical protein